MGKCDTLQRREFLYRSIASIAACIWPEAWLSAAAPIPAQVSGKRPYRPIRDCLPIRPIERPLDWRIMGDAFDAYIMRPENGILTKRADGSLCFASATQASGDGGLTTFGPVVLGKALRGDDVNNFLPSLNAYFSESAGIFLDSPGAQAAEYWYMMNINALAAGLIRKTRSRDAASLGKLRRSADRLIELGHQIDYDFNEQGYDFAKSRPWTKKDIYRQPDAVAGYAYLMLFAYEMFGDQRYLTEARTGLVRYQAFQKNPWYEIPMGAVGCLAAARLSAHYHDAEADFRKTLAFVLDPNDNCLCTGKWGSREVNGLMGGWRTEPPGRAYSMESMVVLPYVLPAVRYNPQYATDVGRYALNVAANMRLFYPDYLPAELQSNPGFAPAIPYERLSEELNGHSPYAAGDYAGHRSVYGGAYALWWGELFRPTKDPYILQFDLAKSDFLAEATHATYLYYNPWPQQRGVTLSLKPGIWDVYDALGHRFVSEQRQGSVHLAIPPSASRVVVLIPFGQKASMAKGVLSFGGVPVDYHAGKRPAHDAE